MISPLQRVLVKRPEAAFGTADPEKWHYTGRPDLATACREHDLFVGLLRDSGAEVIYHDIPQPDHADAIFVFDPVLMTDRGAIILSMGKKLRRGEESAMAACLQALQIPIVYTLHGAARAEGGDLLWVDDKTLAVGVGFRTNHLGLQQLQEAFQGTGTEIIPVELPYYNGPAACLHLLSLISIVAVKTAVVYKPLLSVPFWQRLQQKHFTLIDVPHEEFMSMGTNVLATAPGECLMLAGNPITRKKLEEHGCRVAVYSGTELSLKAEGGPTCLTRPILRRIK